MKFIKQENFYAEDKDIFEKNTFVVFNDKNQRNEQDTFDASLTLLGLSHAIKKFHKIVSEHFLMDV